MKFKNKNGEKTATAIYGRVSYRITPIIYAPGTDFDKVFYGLHHYRLTIVNNLLDDFEGRVFCHTYWNEEDAILKCLEVNERMLRKYDALVWKAVKTTCNNNWLMVNLLKIVPFCYFRRKCAETILPPRADWKK